MDITAEDRHPPQFSSILADEEHTKKLGEWLGQALKPGLIIALNGPLGAGKSTLARALLRYLGVTGTIKSPSYSWVETYQTSSGTINHFDFYRFKDLEEWEAYGFEYYFNNTFISLIEWSEKVASLLPRIDIVLQLDYQASGRHVSAISFTPVGHVCVRHLIQASQMH